MKANNVFWGFRIKHFFLFSFLFSSAMMCAKYEHNFSFTGLSNSNALVFWCSGLCELLDFVRDIDIFQDTLTGNGNPVSHTRIVMDYYFTVDL